MTTAEHPELPENLEQLKLSELRDLARARGLEATGTKPALLARLREHQEQQADADGPGAPIPGDAPGHQEQEFVVAEHDAGEDEVAPDDAPEPDSPDDGPGTEPGPAEEPPVNIPDPATETGAETGVGAPQTREGRERTPGGYVRPTVSPTHQADGDLHADTFRMEIVAIRPDQVSGPWHDKNHRLVQRKAADRGLTPAGHVTADGDPRVERRGGREVHIYTYTLPVRRPTA
ncbi:SAP domain-containing protein [Streptomyces sp. ST2-7A]|uniref:SAP domain-containing protein n=1 Tax=Streptomyces sp. ST2-7A TaxID=2907214 RepID=UPI001F48E4FD|nr:SAP domain-containing protein [Streptomyces sp. ST2-7A]MCE7081152.1 hypothetical protein [Streptomyces sp. ST2-7A]